MKKISLLIFSVVLLFCTHLVFSQNTSHKLREKLDKVFARIDKSQISSGYLAEYAYPFMSLDSVSVSAPIRTIDMTTWRMTYATLQTEKSI